MRNSVVTRELTGELLGLGQSLLKSRSNPASAIIRRTSGIETAHMIRKGQLSEENIPAYKQFIALAG
jgi:hypothetical protein